MSQTIKYVQILIAYDNIITKSLLQSVNRLIMKTTAFLYQLHYVSDDVKCLKYKNAKI